MSKTSNNTSGLSLDACVNGDNIGPYFEGKIPLTWIWMHYFYCTLLQSVQFYLQNLGNGLISIDLVRNRIEVFSMNAVDDRVEADFVPYAYQVGSRLRRALNNVDRREHLEQKAKSKLWSSPHSSEVQAISSESSRDLYELFMRVAHSFFHRSHNVPDELMPIILLISCTVDMWWWLFFV